MPGGADLRASASTCVQIGGDGQGVAAQAAKDGQRHGVLAVGADRHRAVLVRDDHPAQVAHADRLAVLARR